MTIASSAECVVKLRAWQGRRTGRVIGVDISSVQGWCHERRDSSDTHVVTSGFQALSSFGYAYSGTRSFAPVAEGR